MPFGQMNSLINQHVIELEPLWACRVVAKVAESYWHEFTYQHSPVKPEPLFQYALEAPISFVIGPTRILVLLSCPGCFERP